jgi:hypothetical protein
MVDRADLTAALLYVAAIAALTVLLLFFGPEGSNVPATVLAYVFVAFIMGYPGFWALSVRRGLAVRLYRNQALGIALVCLVFFFAVVEPTGVVYAYFLIAIFYWMDASILAARRTDPLLRDTLFWRRLRWVLWGILVLGLVVPSIYQLLTGFDFTTLAIFGPLSSFFILPYLVVPFTGIVLFAVVSRRSADHALRRQLAWFGVFAFTQFATIFAAFGIASFGGLTYFLGFALASFFLYKSARALVPLNRISSLNALDTAGPSMGAIGFDRPHLPT